LRQIGTHAPPIVRFKNRYDAPALIRVASKYSRKMLIVRHVLASLYGSQTVETH
jgi:hypothetical protein